MSQGYPNNVIRTHASIEQAEHEKVADARRVVLTDAAGNFHNADNPFPVEFTGTISIGSVEITGNGNTMAVNTDGSINVNLVTGGTPVPEILRSTYNRAASVPAATSTVIVSYTVPIGKTGILSKIEYSGNNVATYEVFRNSVRIDTQRTYFSYLNGIFDFVSEHLASPFLLAASDLIEIKVTHQRPSVGDFDARIQTIEIG